MNAPVSGAVTPSFLRDWPLPAPGSSKYERGEVLVVGGAKSSPGAVMLAGLSALRLGAGRLTVAVAESVAAHVAVAVPESAVISLSDDNFSELSASLRGAIERADSVLVGPGLDSADYTVDLLRALVPVVPPECTVILDAFALGVLKDLPEVVERLAGRLVLTPNSAELSRLAAADPSGDPDKDVPALAEQYGAVVSCLNVVADGAKTWQVTAGHSGLATSGSGDVLAGAIVGLAARGATLAQATCWGTYVHAAAGDRLIARIGRVGFLARELVAELPLVLTELSI